MSYGSIAYGDGRAVHRASSRRTSSPLAAVGNASLALIALACAGTLYVNLGGPGFQPQPALEHQTRDVIALADPSEKPREKIQDDKMIVTAPPVVTFAERFFAKEDAIAAAPALRKGDRLQVVARAAPPAETLTPQDVAEAPAPAPVPTIAEPPKQVAQAIPLPAPRPSVLKTLASARQNLREIASNKSEQVKSTAQTIFEKLFGKHEPDGATLAYASADGGMVTGSLGNSVLGGVTADGKVSLKPPFDRETAVYDISAKTVYLPDGTKLEAHSGYGDKLDDPRYVDVRMRGATPPHIYDLAMRESLFHGVEAIRLKPVGGEEAIHGRTGLLAHTYMLGPNGDSNGCVSFKDYQKFLAAYKSNKIKRLAVIASLH